MRHECCIERGSVRHPVRCFAHDSFFFCICDLRPGTRANHLHDLFVCFFATNLVFLSRSCMPFLRQPRRPTMRILCLFHLPCSLFALPSSHFPLPTSHFPLPTSLFPLPSSRQAGRQARTHARTHTSTKDQSLVLMWRGKREEGTGKREEGRGKRGEERWERECVRACVCMGPPVTTHPSVRAML